MVLKNSDVRYELENISRGFIEEYEPGILTKTEAEAVVVDMANFIIGSFYVDYKMTPSDLYTKRRLNIKRSKIESADQDDMNSFMQYISTNVGIYAGCCINSVRSHQDTNVLDGIFNRSQEEVNEFLSVLLDYIAVYYGWSTTPR